MIVIFALGGAAALPCGAAAEPAGVNSEYEFGMHLFEAKDYYRAITAFKRQAWLDAKSTSFPSTYMIPLSEHAAGRYGVALGGFERFAKSAPPERLGEASVYYQGRCWDLLGEHTAAQYIFDHSDFKDPELRELGTFALGWSQTLAGNWTAAGASMNRYAELYPEGAKHPLAKRIAHELSDNPPFGQKSERRGLIYSIIPGGGQLYAGKPGDAIYSALLVGASILIAVHGADDDSSFALNFGTILSVTFYLGSIYGGANAIKAHNLKQVDSAMHSFREELQSTGFDDYVLPRMDEGAKSHSNKSKG